MGNLTTRRHSPRKKRHLSIIGALGLVMLLSHQNCAAPLNIDGEEADQTVTYIDDVKSDLALGFASKSLEIHNQVNEVSIKGLCSKTQEGSVLDWAIDELSDGQAVREFAYGNAVCEGANFKIQLAPAQKLECGKAYRVLARLGFGEEGEMVLKRRCAPEAEADGSAFKASVRIQAGTSCVVEKPESSASCSLVCYDANGIVEAKRDISACPL